MSGRSKGRQELADQAMPLTATLTVVACRAGEGLIRELFEPLGYRVSTVVRKNSVRSQCNNVTSTANCLDGVFAEHSLR